MPAPTDKSRLDEIVREIAALLQDKPDLPAREVLGISPRTVQDYAKIETEVDVRSAIELLQTTLDQPIAWRGDEKEPMPLRGKRGKNMEEFAAVLSQIESLQEAIRNMSGPALFMLFSGEDTERLPSVEVYQQTEARLRRFTGALAYWRGRCDHLLAMRGEHGSADIRQRRVAEAAWRLLKLYNKEPADGTADSLYGKVASLLWEAATGERHRDLQRACKDALTTLPTPHQPS
jgi:hypothetical protein